MLERIIFAVTDALKASPLIALSAALAWGVFSVLLSPCHLGTIPLVVGMVGSAKGSTARWQGARLSFAFAGGMLIAILLLGAAVATAGYAVRGFGTATNYVIAAVFIAAGLYLLDLIKFTLPSVSPKGSKRKGVGAAVLIGLVFGIGLSPCTFAFLAPILGMTFGSAATRPVWGMTLLLAFGLGHCGFIGAAGSSTEFVQRYLDWNESSRAATALKYICGVAVLLAAGVLIYTA